MAIPFIDVTLVVCLGHVKSGEPLLASKRVQNVLDPWDRLSIRNSLQVELTIVDAHPHGTILLTHHHNRTTVGRH